MEPYISTTLADNPAGNVGYTAIAIGNDGLPIIAFQNGTVLRVTRCGSLGCAPAGSLSTDVDSPGTPVGEGASIAIGSDNLPIISHHVNVPEALRVTHCGDVTCTAGNVSTSIDTVPGNVIGWNTSLAIGSDGLPIISHQNSTTQSLRVTHCGSIDCTTGNTSTTVDTTSVGEFNSIAIGADGLPVISHRVNARALRLTLCGNATCTSGNVSKTIDAPTDAVGLYTSIAIGADGKPIISHFNETHGSLRTTKCKSVTCQ